MGIGLVIAVLGVGSTLASTITINGGTNTEFGQGVQRTVYCGGNKQITIKPIAGYLNKTETSTPISENSEDGNDAVDTSTPGNFYLSGIRISDIPEECSGVDFVLSAYATDGTDPVNLASINGGGSLVTPTIFWKKVSDGYISELSAQRDHWVSAAPMAAVTLDRYGSVVITFDKFYANMNINDVGRILIESQNDAINEDFLSLSQTPVHSRRG
jgi:hypothetical protein